MESVSAGNTLQMQPVCVVALGASAGGVEALRHAVHGLPADLPAVVLVTLHVGPGASSQLPHILSRAGPLPAAHPRDGEIPKNGHLYVAPPGRHLLLRDGHLELNLGPIVNHYRPAIDPMFASIARCSGASAIAVVLSGMLDDGAAGAALVARAGGRVLVQDPLEALYPAMPTAALAAVDVAVTIAAAQLGSVLARIGPRTHLSTS